VRRRQRAGMAMAACVAAAAHASGRKADVDGAAPPPMACPRRMALGCAMRCGASHAPPLDGAGPTMPPRNR